MSDADFAPSDRVRKHSGKYGGPGIVRAVEQMPDGHTIVIVAHKIEGGFGEFLHIYAPAQLEHLREPADAL